MDYLGLVWDWQHATSNLAPSIANQARIPAPILSHLQAHATSFAIPFPQKFFSFPWDSRVHSKLPGGEEGSEEMGGGVDNDAAHEKIMVLIRNHYYYCYGTNITITMILLIL